MLSCWQHTIHIVNYQGALTFLFRLVHSHSMSSLSILLIWLSIGLLSALCSPCSHSKFDLDFFKVWVPVSNHVLGNCSTFTLNGCNFSVTMLFSLKHDISLLTSLVLHVLRHALWNTKLCWNYLICCFSSSQYRVEAAELFLKYLNIIYSFHKFPWAQ